MHCTCQLTALSMSALECGVRCHMTAIQLTLTLNCISFRVITQYTSRLRCEWLVGKLYGVAKMPFLVFPRGILWHAFCVWILRCSACAAVEEYQRRFPDRRIPSQSVFTRIHQTLRDTGSLPSVSVLSEREVVRTINTRQNILQMVQRSPRLSTRRMSSHIGISRMQVWRTLHEEYLYPYQDQRVQYLEPGDHAQRMDFCHWIKAHPELLSVILFVGREEDRQYNTTN